MSVLPPLGPPNGAAGPMYLSGWDRSLLGGYVMPGKSRTKGCAVKLKKDKKSKAGSDGARPTYHGIDLKDFEIEIDTWTDEQREKLVEICRKILPVPGRKSNPLAFDHPSIRHFGMPIKVQIVGAGEMTFDSDHHTKLIISVQHWVQPSASKKSATNTPTRTMRDLRAEAAGLLLDPNLPPIAQDDFGVPPVTYTPSPTDYVSQ